MARYDTSGEDALRSELEDARARIRELESRVEDLEADNAEKQAEIARLASRAPHDNLPSEIVFSRVQFVMIKASL